MAVAIVENHHWAEYVVGVSNIETLEPVTADALFNVASISKVLTAPAVMQLVEGARWIWMPPSKII